MSLGCRHLLKLSRLESVNRTAQPPAELGFCQRSHGSPAAGHHSHRRSTCRITGVPSEPAALKDLGDASRTWCEQRKQGRPALSVLPRQLSRDTLPPRAFWALHLAARRVGKGNPASAVVHADQPARDHSARAQAPCVLRPGKGSAAWAPLGGALPCSWLCSHGARSTPGGASRPPAEQQLGSSASKHCAVPAAFSFWGAKSQPVRLTVLCCLHNRLNLGDLSICSFL